MKNENKTPIIIEDVVYYDQTEKGYKCLAKDTFYYNFLMNRSTDEINGQSNLMAATDFLNYEKIYVALLDKLILKNPTYVIDWCDIDGGACFSLNLSAVLNDFDLEKILRKEFEDEPEMEKYISNFCNPPEYRRCHVCGAFSFSRFIEYSSSDNEKHVYCLACSPLKDELKEKVKKVFQTKGTEAAVKERIEIIDDACRVKIPEGKTIDGLIDDFIEYNQPGNMRVADPRYFVIKNILEEADRTDLQVFPYENGVAILNRAKLKNIDNFSNTVAMSEDGTEIIALFDKPGLCWCDEKAIEFAKKLAENTKYEKLF